jgi:hypothetical protein
MPNKQGDKSMKEKKIRIRVRVSSFVKKALEKRAEEGFRSLQSEILMILSKAIKRNSIKTILILLLVITAPALAFADSDYTLAPDGTYVGGNESTLAPNGTYVGGNQATLAPNGSYVGGSSYTLAPNGTYVGGNQATLAPDGTYVGGNQAILTPKGTYVGDPGG